MKNLYFVEMTDTFGGDANYCWVNRFMVKANTARGAMRKVSNETGYFVRNAGGDRWDAVGACICYFVTDSDGSEFRNYSNIKTL